ncbi:unnamed protein product [marine sediment metagenome]|uniref:Uncharacterized protein n=1 Tax=marine sediment metagenome TaxID=412755 RepID=X0Y1E0_9ZZZZ
MVDMGACDFSNLYIGTKTPQEAFNELSDEARSEYGTDSYNGTISTTDLVKVVELPARMGPGKYVEKYVDEVGKWECWCVELKRSYLQKVKKQYPSLKGKKGIRAYVFFGWASM